MTEEDQVIKTREELEFAVFCIESLALALHRDPPLVYQLLNNQSSILADYIIPMMFSTPRGESTL